ncbi:MAG: hypothetical protein KAI24_03070 [Planctomycetes bacterium]|nr:hypothetical protein [Planctomycetota bacterium]
MRWFWWFAVVPQTFLLVGYLRDLGLPSIDMAVLSALFLAWFARISSLPFLLLAVAIGRALVDQASLPVHLLVLGVPVALLLPLRSLFVAQRWLWQAVAAALLAIAIPKLSGLCGAVFDQPSTGSTLDGWRVVWAALLLPPLLSALRLLPPFRAFVEASELTPGGGS